MFDTSIDIFWMAFIGLSLSMLGFSALVYSNHQSNHRTARLRRANGTDSGRSLQASPKPQGSVAAIALRMRHVIIQIGERFAVVLGGEARETASHLASAGYKGRDALLIYAFLKTFLPLAALCIGVIRLFLIMPFGIEMMVPVAIVIAAALALSKAVDMFVDMRRKKRMNGIRRAFPDMLEMVVITSEAGLGPQPALHRVAHEMSLTHPELAQEILQMVSEMAMTNDTRSAYEQLNIRVPLPEIGVFTQTLDQSDRYGTPFSSAMRTLIAEQRANRLMAVEEKAARLPVLMTLPLIFCIMPAVFVVLVGPAALSVFDNIIAGG